MRSVAGVGTFRSQFFFLFFSFLRRERHYLTDYLVRHTEIQIIHFLFFKQVSREVVLRAFPAVVGCEMHTIGVV